MNRGRRKLVKGPGQLSKRIGRPSRRKSGTSPLEGAEYSAGEIISGDLDDPITPAAVAGPSGISTSFKVPNRPPPPPPPQQKKGRISERVQQQKKGKTSERAEQLLREDLPSDVLNTRRPATKVRFNSKKAGSRDKTKENIDLDQPGVRESLEVCQGFSKIKLEDWFGFFDFKHNERSAPEGNANLTPEANNAASVDEGTGDEDDEWEETLVYVDLEDISHADGLFASLAPSSGNNGEGEEDTGAALSHIEMKIFNMDSELPVLLLGGKYLAGQWQDSIGTSLFFKKKSEQLTSSPTPHSSSDSPGSSSNLSNIVPEPEIPFDQLFGDNYTGKDEEGYELVAKSFKVLKAKYVPVVNDDQKREDFIRDNDDEFDHRDFQIPPVNLIRQFTTVKDLNYEKYIQEDINRRRRIYQKWGSKGSKGSTGELMLPTVKTEPVPPVELDCEEDGFLIRDDDISEPIPGSSHHQTT